MKKTNLILFAVLALVIALGGFFWFRQGKEARSPVFEPSLQQVSTKAFEPVAGEEGWVWFPVPELGIEIKVKADIAPELVYKASKLSAEHDIVSTRFTTKKLNDIATKNGLNVYDNDGGYTCAIGIFTRYNVARKDLEKLSDYGYIQPSVADVDGYFVFYGSPQASCTYGSDDKKYNASDREYEQYVVSNWWESNFENLKESLQQSVRKLK